MANKRGIDVSSHNGQVDWDKAQAAGLDFAILRCGWGVDRDSQDDSTFARNVAECDRLGIPWGAYLYSYAMNIDEANSEADHILRLLKGHKPSYPIIIDMEDTDGYKAQRGGNTLQMNTEIIKTVCRRIEDAGYYAMWYANKDWCDNHIDTGALAAFDFWYARPGIDAPDKPCGIWQDGIGSTGSSWPGANNSAGYCDTNLAYKDYPAIIKQAGLNGWGETPGNSSEPVKPSQPAAKFQKGDKVKVLRAVQYENGASFTTYYDSYDVIEVSGNRVVIGIGSTVTAAVHADNLAKVGASAPAAAIQEDDRVRVKQGASSYEGAPIASFVYSGTYTVDELRGDRAVLDEGGICTAFRVSDLIKA